MDFGLSEEQELLQQSLRGYLRDRVPLPRVREIVESESGYDTAVLQGLAEQGVPGALIPESYGGSGLGLLDAALIAEEFGRAVTPYNFHAWAVMAPLVVLAAASETQKQTWLPRLATGKACVPVAFVDERVDERDSFVAAAPDTDAYIVFCGRGADTEAYLIPADTPGLQITALKQVDLSRRLSALALENVELDDSMRLGEGGADPAAVRERVLAAGRIVLAADALGAAERALEAAVEYAQTRKQFGRVIASFQAVKHMCAETVAELEPLRSLLWYAAFAWDEEREEATEVAASLKAHAGEVTTRAVTTCTQVFGGMGFTWECDMHLWFKRVGYDRQVFGGPVALRAEAARRKLDDVSDGSAARPTRP